MSDKLKQKNWPKAVIMDLDGTLIDSAPDIALSLNKALKDFDIEGFSLEDVRFMIGGGVPKLVERAFDARDLPHDDLLKKAIAKVTDYYTKAPADNTNIYPGVKHTMQSLKDKGIKVGLCTNKPQEITEIALKHLGLTKYFEVIIGATDDTPRKPDPMTLQMAVDGLGMKADDCLLVGDSGADAGAAKALDMAVFLVEYGYSKTPVKEYQPDATLAKMDDLLTILFQSDEIPRG